MRIDELANILFNITAKTLQNCTSISRRNMQGQKQKEKSKHVFNML